MSCSPELAWSQLHRCCSIAPRRSSGSKRCRRPCNGRTAHSQGRKPALESVRRRVDQILAAQHLRQLLPTQVREQDGLAQLGVEIDEARLATFKPICLDAACG